MARGLNAMWAGRDAYCIGRGWAIENRVVSQLEFGAGKIILDSGSVSLARYRKKWIDSPMSARTAIAKAIRVIRRSHRSLLAIDCIIGSFAWNSAKS
jgi:hypothetical protein